VRKRRFAIVGDGGGIWSFVHLDDAASATVLALERGAPGVYNVVDDEPAPVSEWLPALADAIGAKPPRRVPLGWTLRYPTWRKGSSSRIAARAPRPRRSARLRVRPLSVLSAA
jgi:nucleoside-diphosphate-sugar epimerase